MWYLTSNTTASRTLQEWEPLRNYWAPWVTFQLPEEHGGGMHLTCSWIRPFLLLMQRPCDIGGTSLTIWCVMIKMLFVNSSVCFWFSNLLSLPIYFIFSAFNCCRPCFGQSVWIVQFTRVRDGDPNNAPQTSCFHVILYRWWSISALPSWHSR